MEAKIETDGLSKSELNLLVLIRDRFSCQIHQLIPELEKCSTRDITELHHIKERINGGRDSFDNLICLCRAHHDLIHGVNGETIVPYLRIVIAENKINLTEIGSVVGISQPAMSQILKVGDTRVRKAIKIKDFLNTRLKKEFTVEELFAPVRLSKEEREALNHINLSLLKCFQGESIIN
jgi:hypothetical protein